MITIVFLLIGFTSCDFLIPTEKKDTSYSRSVIPYELHEPDKVIQLSTDLEEISGLAYYNEGQLIAINDEDGNVFVLSEEGKVINKIKFDRGDDYEGIATTGKKIFVLKANGDIHQVGKRNQKVKTPLKHKNNGEGLSYDKNANRLLIACKGEAGIEEDIEGKAVYAYNLVNKELNTEPVLIIKVAELDKFIKKRDKELEIIEFNPSGIAIHPITGHIYIIAHKGKTLAVYDNNFALLEVVRLSREHYKQAEGICFSPDGSKLFVSNEGRGASGNLLVFHQKNK